MDRLEGKLFVGSITEEILCKIVKCFLLLVRYVISWYGGVFPSRNNRLESGRLADCLFVTFSRDMGVFPWRNNRLEIATTPHTYPCLPKYEYIELVFCLPFNYV